MSLSITLYYIQIIHWCRSGDEFYVGRCAIGPAVRKKISDHTSYVTTSSVPISPFRKRHGRKYDLVALLAFRSGG